ncbi:MAG: TetR/AcrR family transcriptional regulator [Solirubrobacterales bacterium]
MEDTLTEQSATLSVREVRRTELLDIAIEVISENGLDNTSFRTLARKAGTSTTTFTYEFGSREELLAAILRRAFEIHWSRKGFDLDNDSDDPLEKLRRAAWLGVQAQPEIDPWIRTYDRFLFEFSFRPELEAEIQQLEALMMERYLTLIDLAREQGQIDPGISAQDALFLVWSMIDGLNIHRYVYEEELDRERTLMLFNEGFNRIMRVRSTD